MVNINCNGEKFCLLLCYTALIKNVYGDKKFRGSDSGGSHSSGLFPIYYT